MTVQDIVVEIKLLDRPKNRTLAFADVIFLLGDFGKLTVTGFRVVADDERGPWLSMPQRRGGTKWYDIVTLTGPVAQTVKSMALQSYRRASAPVASAATPVAPSKNEAPC